MKILFESPEERDAFHSILEMAEFGGLDTESSKRQALDDAWDADPLRPAYDAALKKINEEYTARMKSFLRAFATVVRLAKKDDDGRVVTTSHADFEDMSLIWRGHMTVGMIFSPAERPWAGTWSCHS